MFPLLTIPIYNRIDLLHRLITSIDFPVKKLLIVNNNQLALNYGHLKSLSEFVQQIDIYVPDANIGVAGSWNFAIQSNDVDCWLICNNDIMFHPGTLAQCWEAWQTNKTACVIDFNYSTCFLLSRHGFNALGYFDENFYPAYFEDIDYETRAKILKESYVKIHLPITHEGSSTIKSDEKFSEWVSKMFEWNEKYFCRKWGVEDPRGLKIGWLHPFNSVRNVSQWELERPELPHFRTTG